MPAPGEQKEQIIKENYPVLGDSGRALCEVETQSTRPDEQYHPLVESDDFSEWNPEQKRLFGTCGWNFPGLRMMQKKDALEWSAESSAKMSRRQSIRSPRE